MQQIQKPGRLGEDGSDVALGMKAIVTSRNNTATEDMWDSFRAKC